MRAISTGHKRLEQFEENKKHIIENIYKNIHVFTRPEETYSQAD